MASRRNLAGHTLDHREIEHQGLRQVAGGEVAYLDAAGAGRDCSNVNIVAVGSRRRSDINVYRVGRRYHRIGQCEAHRGKGDKSGAIHRDLAGRGVKRHAGRFRGGLRYGPARSGGIADALRGVAGFNADSRRDAGRGDGYAVGDDGATDGGGEDLNISALRAVGPVLSSNDIESAAGIRKIGGGPVANPDKRSTRWR